MKFILIFYIFILFNNCSLNNNSSYWTKSDLKKNNNEKDINLKNTIDLTNMTSKEYEIYMDVYVKKSKYPNISQ